MKKELNSQACRIIEALGGTGATAKLCDVEPPAVSQWRKEGIPRARLMFLQLARPDVFKSALPQVSGEVVSENDLSEERRREVDLGYRQAADPKNVSE